MFFHGAGPDRLSERDHTSFHSVTRKYESGDKQDLLKMQLHLLSFSFPWRTMLKFLSCVNTWEILAECDTSPKQQLEPWVKCQSQSTLCALLSPFKLPAIKDDSPLLNLHGVCYLEKKWEGKGAAWECHIHWWTCRNIHPEGACFFRPFYEWTECHTLASWHYPTFLGIYFRCIYVVLVSLIKQVATCTPN